MMKFMRKAHNYLGLILFVQIGLWFLSGLVMAWLPIDEVRGNHLRNRVTTSWHSASVTPSDILRNHSSTAVLSLTHRINEVGLAEPGSLNAIPVYHVVDDNIAYRYSALTGEALQTMQQSAIRKAAKGQYAGTGDIGETQLLSVLPQEVQNLSAPLWQGNFDDDLNSRFYIDPNTGSVLRVRTDAWRLFDFMWMLHIMDYKDRSNFNTPWLIAFSGSAFLFTLTGVALLYKRFKPKKKKR